MKDDSWRMSKHVQFTGVNFPDINPNSYDNLNNMKLECLHQARSNLVQVTKTFSLVSFLSVFRCIFKRALTWAFVEMKPFARELDYIAIYLLWLFPYIQDLTKC